MRKKLWLALLIGLSLITTAWADKSETGGSFYYSLISQDPDNLHGYRAALWYQPGNLIWKHVRVYFDGGMGYWWIANSNPHHSLYIVSLSPVLRYYYRKRYFLTPFLELSIGLSYLSKTRLATNNLGMHFAFQDRVGIGAAFGDDKRFSLGASAIHYSNASLCKHNSGMTIPLLVTLGYRF